MEGLEVLNNDGGHGIFLPRDGREGGMAAGWEEGQFPHARSCREGGKGPELSLLVSNPAGATLCFLQDLETRL